MSDDREESSKLISDVIRFALSPYYIERFRNFGDAYFYDLSNKIAKLDSIMSQFKTIPFINEISEG